MPTNLVRSLIPVALVAAACAPGSGFGVAPDPPARDVRRSAQAGALSDLPLSFIENRGQADRRAAFYLQGAGSSAWFTSEGVRISMPQGRGRYAVELGFEDARRVRPAGEERTGAVVSYFTGPRSEWHTGVPTYRGVVYRDLWPGISLAYSGDQRRLKYELRLAPGADPSAIRLRWNGATSLTPRPDGSLRIATPAGALTDDAPVSFQGTRRVETSFVTDGTSYGFRLGEYDRTKPLVIDPAVFVYAGFIGGTDADFGRGIDVDGAGAAYVVGSTQSTEGSFPVAVGPDLSANGGSDAFVAKVSPSGTSLEYVGFIGGAAGDTGAGIAVDASGAAYLTGATSSSETSFPVVGGPDLLYNGGADAFVAKVAPSGASLVYSGYIGGSLHDVGMGVALDPTGAAYLVGHTTSPQATFPVAGGPDGSHNGSLDVFAAKVVPSGAALAYSGYIGGADVDVGAGIAVDNAGAAYLSGSTSSTEITFPESVGPDLSFNGGPNDAFVAKLTPAGGALEYAGYIGGTGDDVARAIAVDASGAAYVAGHAVSTEASFPVAVGPDLTHNGGQDAFVAKIAQSGAAFAYSGFIGGSNNDVAYGVGVDGSGAVHLTGSSSSTEATFPVRGGPDLTHNGAQDAFVAKVDPSTALVFAGFIGGSSGDAGSAIAMDPSGDLYVTGDTTSTEATFPVAVGPDGTYNGLSEAFVAKVTEDVCLGAAATIEGTSGNDTLTGTPGADVIMALAGNDVIDGGGGHDLICAGDGDDTLAGGTGDDRLDGEAGIDTGSFAGRIGVVVDLILGTATGLGADTLAGIENLTGSSKRDVLRGSAVANTIRGSGGADRIAGRGAKDRLLGQAGDDRLAGGGANDRLAGGKGDDRMNGGAGKKDRCNGGAGSGDRAARCETVTGVP